MTNGKGSQERDLGPLVTVGIPVFNGEETLSSCIDSLMAQTYTKLEILVFDNCSVDETKKIVDLAKNSDNRIKYFRSEKNLGGVHSFNSLLNLASGEFFMWAAADDFRPPRYIEQALLHLQATPEASLSAPVTEGYVEGFKDPIYRVSVPDFTVRKDFIRRTYMHLTNFPTTAIYGLFRTEKAKETLGLERSIATDVAFLFEIALRGVVVSNEEQVLVMNRRKKRNANSDDYRVFFGDGDFPRFLPPFMQLLSDRCKRVWKIPESFTRRLLVILLIFACETRRIFFILVIKLFKGISKRRLFSWLILKIHWRFIHKPNYEILDEEVYKKRIIMSKYI